MLLTLSLVANLSLSLALYGVVRYLKSLNREQAREVSMLLQSNTDLTDRIMHTQGVTWTPPPRPVPEVEETPTESEWLSV